MNKQHEALYDAITGIDAEYIEESTRPPRRTQNRILRFTAAAAVLALLLTLPGLLPKEDAYVTAPGMLAIRAYALTEEDTFTQEGTIMETGVNFPLTFAWHDGLSSAYGLPIYFSISDPGIDNTSITWEITLDDGDFYMGGEGSCIPGGTFYPDRGGEECYEDENGAWIDPAQLGNHFTIPDDSILLWTNYTTDGIHFNFFTGNHTYVSAIARVDDNIVGYAVIKLIGSPNPLNKLDKNACYTPLLVAANYYPMVNGEFQEITEEYIQQQIQFAKSL